MTLLEDLAVLGLALPKFKARDYPHAVELLAEWQRGPLKAAFRVAAKRSHPDRNPGDEDASSRFREVSDAYERLRGLRVRPPRPPVPLPSTLIRMGRPRASSETTNSSVTVSVWSAFA